MHHCFLLSRKSLRFLGSAMGIAIANRKNRCDFGALRFTIGRPPPHTHQIPTFLMQFLDYAVNRIWSEVSKRGWRREGVGARKSFICQRFRPLFCTLFPYALVGEGGRDAFLENFLGLFFGFVCGQPPPANPFSKPLKWIPPDMFYLGTGRPKCCRPSSTR